MTSASRGVSLMTFINSSGINGETSSVTSFLNFCAELRIFNPLAHRCLQDRDPILGGSRRQNEWRGRRSETTPHRQELLFLISLSKTLDLRQLGEAWVRMLIALWNFQDRMKIHYPLFHPFRIAP